MKIIEHLNPPEVAGNEKIHAIIENTSVYPSSHCLMMIKAGWSQDERGRECLINQL